MSEKPVKPDDSDCCGSGCKPCVFDVYEERLKKWESKRETFTESTALDQIKYLPFLIFDIQHNGEFLLQYKFQAVTLKEGNNNFIHIKSAKLGFDFEILQEMLKINSGEYLILKGVFDTEVISRSYTPILNKNEFNKGIFSIIISLQANGKMSDFLKKLQVNDIVFWRGSYRELIHDMTSFKHILLFGGGTGIVPLYNIAKTIVEDEESEIWVNVIASFKNVNSIILRKEFSSLRDFWNFHMEVYITNANESGFKAHYKESIVFNRIDESVVKKELDKCNCGDFFVIVCGPERFNHFVVNALKKFEVKDENIFIFW